MDLTMQSYAKINLALDVLEDREDGYHEIDTIMQELDLFDEITIETGRGGFVLTCDQPVLPLDENNLVYLAWKALENRVANNSVNIHIKKRIPVASGLAGGSSNAAATLVGLSKFWDLNVTSTELEEIAAEIGSDVPFFIQGGTQRARGRGEILEELPTYADKNIVLITVDQRISSRYVYEKVENNGNFDIDSLVKYMEADSPKAYDLMQNQLETVSLQEVPELGEIKQGLERMGADVALMSGSGPTVFGLFESREAAEEVYKHVEDKFPFVYLTRTISHR